MTTPLPVSLNMQDLGNIIRQWVHFDTLVANFNKQVHNARQFRDKIEKEILQKLKGSNYEKAVIQIAGGRIIVSDEKHTQPLTFKTLEELLHEYYRQRPVQHQNKDETADILKFIKTHRSFETYYKLKRQITS
jgi:hypothetical protein